MIIELLCDIFEGNCFGKIIPINKVQLKCIFSGNNVSCIELEIGGK